MIAAARPFVCVRLATYEDATETKLLTEVFRGRSGQLENTVFTILSPDGKKRLARSGRSPGMTYGWGEEGVTRFVAALNGIAKRYRPRVKVAALPVLKSVRLGLNVAACDSVPLVVTIAATAKSRTPAEAAIAKASWDDARKGRFAYAACASAKELASAGIRGVPNVTKPAIVVIQPGAYGVSGDVLAHGTDLRTAAVTAVLDKGLRAHKAAHKTNHRDHVRSGRRKGIHWETETPVTDPGRAGPRGR